MNDEPIVYFDPATGLTAGLMHPPPGPPSLGDQVRELDARRAAEVKAELRADEDADRRWMGAVGMSPAERLAEIQSVDAERQRKTEAKARALAEWCAANGVSESDFTEQAIPVPHSSPARSPYTALLREARTKREEAQAAAEVEPVSKAEFGRVISKLKTTVENTFGKRLLH